MRFLAAGALLLLTVTGCSKPEKNLHGRWAVDLEALTAAASEGKTNADAKKKAIKLAKTVASQMNYEFTADGKLNVNFGKVRRSGTYKVKSSSGDTLTVATTLKSGDKEKSDTVKIKLLGKDSIEITAADGKSVKFSKQGR